MGQRELTVSVKTHNGHCSTQLWQRLHGDNRNKTYTQFRLEKSYLITSVVRISLPCLYFFVEKAPHRKGKLPEKRMI